MEIYRKVAQNVKARLDEGGYSFITIPYKDLQAMYRDASNNDATRFAKCAREGIEEALLDLGVRVFPSFEEAQDAVRFFRSNTILWNIVTNLRYPNSRSDAELSELLNRIKRDPAVVIVMPPSL